MFVTSWRPGAVQGLEPAKLGHGLRRPRSLKPQLLVVAELPNGWAVDNSSDSGSTSAPRCLTTLKSTLSAAGKVKRDFVRGANFPSEQLGYYASSSAAIAKYNAGAAILNNCQDVSFTSNGRKITGSIGSLSFSNVGQRSSAWRIRLSALGVKLGIVAVLVQKGPELAVLLFGDFGSPDLTEAAALVRKAVAKMPTP